MKHGPIALIDAEMPVMVLLKQGPLFEKMISNIQEVKARDGMVLGLIEDEPNAILGPPENQFVVALLLGMAFARALQCPAAVARLSRGGASRHRRRSAKKSGQERNGGVGRGGGTAKPGKSEQGRPGTGSSGFHTLLRVAGGFYWPLLRRPRHSAPATGHRPGRLHSRMNI